MSDTPETDAIDAEIVQLVADAIKNNVALSDVLGMALTKHVNLQKKLERERNEANCLYKSAVAAMTAFQSERNQLRKVADELAEQYRHEMMSMFGHASDCDCSRCEPMTKLYNSLPHVIERKAK